MTAPVPPPGSLTATDAGFVESNGLRLSYESFGRPDDPAVLMVMGLGTQMIGWPDWLCRAVADQGYRVIRFDNRDVGLSAHLDGTRVPGVAEMFLHPRRVPYTIDDMADDAAGLLTGLGIASAHVVGASMGGFIGQTMAIRHPGRVRSLALIMTTTGSRRVGNPKLAVAARLARPRAVTGRDAAIDAVVTVFKVIGSPGYEFDESYVRDLAARSYDRAYDPDGYLRQLAACIAQPNRTRRLRRLDVPAVVIHGLADPLVAPSGGLALARAVPGAHFVGLAGMGHDLPRPLWGRVANEILAVAARGDQRTVPHRGAG